MLTTTLALTALAFTPEEEPLQWFQGTHEQAIEAAAAEKKPLLTYFWANTENCSRLYGETMQNPAVVAEMREMILYSADAGQDAGRALLESHQLETVPALLVTSPAGQSEEMMLGYMDAPTFVGEIQRIKRGENTISDLRRKVAGEHEALEEELAQRRMLSEKLDFVGARDESREVFLSILERDRRGETPTGAASHVTELIDRMVEAAGEDRAKWDLRPLTLFVKKIPSAEPRFTSMISLADMQLEKGESRDGVKTLMLAWKERPESETVLGSGFGIVGRIESLAEELGSKEREFALEVAEEPVPLAEAADTRPCEGCADGAVVDDGGDCCGDRESVRPRALYTVARCQALNGDEAAAIATMEQVVALVPEDETFDAYLATLRAGSNS